MLDRRDLTQLLAALGIAAVPWTSLWYLQRMIANTLMVASQSSGRSLVRLPLWFARLCGNPMRDGRVEPTMALFQLLWLAWFVETVVLVIAVQDYRLRTAIISFSFFGVLVFLVFGGFAIRQIFRHRKKGE